MNDFDDLCKGASISQLAELFAMNRRTATNRLRNCPASGIRNGNKIYRISEAAPHLLKVLGDDYDDDDGNKRTPDVEKDYWDARLKEQKFLENDGDLRRRADIIHDLSKIIKIFSLQIRLLADNIERETGLTNKQREVATRLVFDALNSVSRAVQEGDYSEAVELAESDVLEEEEEYDIFGD